MSVMIVASLAGVVFSAGMAVSAGMAIAAGLASAARRVDDPAEQGTTVDSRSSGFLAKLRSRVKIRSHRSVQVVLVACMKRMPQEIWRADGFSSGEEMH